MAIKITIDPGHVRGYNPGAAAGYSEGTAMFTLAGYLKSELEKYSGFSVQVTRTQVTQDLTLDQRGKMAIDNGSKLFLSLHSNGFSSATAKGVVLFYSLKRPASKALGDKLGQAVTELMNSGTGVTYYRGSQTREYPGWAGNDYYGVIRSAVCGACVEAAFLLEHGFHSNPQECAWLNNDANLRRLAEREAEVIAEYYGAKKTGATGGSTAATKPIAQAEFICKVGALATEDMRKTGILAALTTAQAIIESASGTSELATKANALFGIKADGRWKGKTYSKPTQEYLNGKWVTVNAPFRAYDSWEESIADHSAFLTGNPRYAKVVGERDYKAACQYIHEAGYATAPTYAESLVFTIEKYALNRFNVPATDTPAQGGQDSPVSVTKGETVQFKGGSVYTSASAAQPASTKPASTCTVTQVFNGGKHPYHLVSKDSKGVYGWVDATCIAKGGSNAAPGAAMRQGAKVRYSGRLYADSLGNGPGKDVDGEFIVSRYIPGRKCGVLLGSVGWVPESACKVIS